MGAHVWGPAFLRDHLLPNFQLNGWSMDWYAGMPVYRFYMVVPALAIVALDTILPVRRGVQAGRRLRARRRCRSAAGRSAGWPGSATRCPSCSPSPGCASRSTRASASTAATSSRRWPASSRSRSRSASAILGLGLLASGDADRAVPQLGGDRARRWPSSATASSPSTSSLGRARHRARQPRHVRRLVVRRSRVGIAVVLLSAFWIGPFVGNHEYMTDMKYGARPDGRQRLVLGHVLPAHRAARHPRHGAGGHRLRRLASPAATLNGTALGVIGLLHRRPRLPHPATACRSSGCCGTRGCCRSSTSSRYLLMMVGVVEVVALRRQRLARPPRRATPVGWVAGSVDRRRRRRSSCCVVLGFMFEVLPGGGRRVVHDAGKPVYAWGPFRKTATGAATPRATAGRATTSRATRAARSTPSTTTSCRRWPSIGATERLRPGRRGRTTSDNGQYGTTMALMLLPHWTDGCIASMEGLFFEASGTTPYHFLTTAAMSKQSSNPVRELRYDNNDAADRRAVPAGARRALRDGPHRRGQARGRRRSPSSTLLADERAVGDLQVADSDIVVPLDVQPVVVDERARRPARAQPRARHELVPAPRRVGGDARPTTARTSWQRIDVAVDESRLVPDPNRRPTIPTPAASRSTSSCRSEPIEPVALPPVDGQRRRDRASRTCRSTSTRSACPVLVKVSYFPNWDGRRRRGPVPRRAEPDGRRADGERRRACTYERSALGPVLLPADAGSASRLLIVLRIRGDVDLDGRSPPPAVAGAGAGRTTASGDADDRAADGRDGRRRAADGDRAERRRRDDAVASDDDPASDRRTVRTVRRAAH